MKGKKNFSVVNFSAVFQVTFQNDHPPTHPPKKKLILAYIWTITIEQITVKPRVTNNSVYEQIFPTQCVSDDVLCLELQTRKPSKRRPKTNYTGQLFSETEAQWV